MNLNKHIRVFSIFDFGEMKISQPIECEINTVRILLRRKLSCGGEGTRLNGDLSIFFKR